MKILITYEYFTPAYKAGGPIQSLDNLVQSFNDGDYEFYIYCSATDLDGITLDVKPDNWIKYNEYTQVYYRSSGSIVSIKDILKAAKPDVIFINGLFSQPFSIQPLRAEANAVKIVSARGMLHPGALSQKSFKKKLFLAGFKWMGLHKKAAFHATTEEEAVFIKNALGKQVKVWVAPNLPKQVKDLKPLPKAQGSLQLVSIALISPMKNIKLVLLALKYCTAQISYDIYGPVKNEAYWNECLEVIKVLPANVKVQYKGAIPPETVPHVLEQYHCFILPSKSENFGHAIYEALASGKPVITSHYTPWNGLQAANAGNNVSLEDINEMTAAINEVAAYDNNTYTAASNGAAQYAAGKIDIAAIKAAYRKMFASKN